MGKDKKDAGKERTQEPFNDRGQDTTVNETGNDSRS